MLCESPVNRPTVQSRPSTGHGADRPPNTAKSAHGPVPAVGPMSADRPVIREVFPGEALVVRAALAEMLAALAPRLASAEVRGRAEIVLAEVLNNIVEHACRIHSGPIEMQLRLGPESIEVFIADEGRPFPGGTLPRGRPLEPQEAGGLPEGGFGWTLIRSLSRDLTYRRQDGRNELRFRLTEGQSRAER